MKRLILIVATVLLLGVVACAPDETPSRYSPPPLNPAQITVAALTANPSIATWDEVITITVALVNTGDVQGTYLAILKLNDKKQYETSVTVPGNSTKYVSFQTKGGLGVYNASVGGMSVGYTVVRPQTTALPGAPLSSDYQRQLDELNMQLWILQQRERQTGQGNYQMEELRRQTEELRRQQEQELQRLQDQQKRQMREYYLGQAKVYDDMAAAAETQGDKIRGYNQWPPPDPSKSLEREIEAEPYYQLARQYRQQALNYRLEALKYR